MTEAVQGQISFEVETSRILEILSKEIYDSSNALLRENIQNAYDAVLMRCSAQGVPITERLIEITIENEVVKISDDGIGMTEEVLRQNFWKAGSSGKRTELAREAGVVGTFGIGAMANFGVCTELQVETKAIESDVTLISTAVRRELKIGQDCITLSRAEDGRAPGTTVIAKLDQGVQISPDQARDYLNQFIRYLPVRITLNGELISQQSFDGDFEPQLRDASELLSTAMDNPACTAQLDISVNQSSSVIARLTNISLQGSSVRGEILLVQDAGRLMGYRNYFGLAPVPISGHYQFGGCVNLDILQPTAGREALSRESIEQVNQIVQLTEDLISEALSKSDAADRNSRFLEYVKSRGRTDLAGRVTVEIKPDDVAIPLEEVQSHCSGKNLHYYAGRDQAILQTFSSAESCVVHLSQSNPRRSVQQQYVTQILGIAEVPDQATLMNIYHGPDLTLAEAALLLRVSVTLAEDYLFPSPEIRFADISHGVAVLVEGAEANCKIYLARDSSIVQPVIECHRTAYEVFGGFVKDFVRIHLYPRISSLVPSSTREGADALLKVLQRSRELYRYEESEFGQIDSLLAEYLAGDVTFAEILNASTAKTRPHTQTVTSTQVGTIEDQIPDIMGSPAPTPEEIEQQYGAAPALLRTDASSEMKVLLASTQYPQLNNFEMFLGLSDRLFNRDGTFFHSPHTTKIIWGSHRVIYIFGHASGEFTLYYDIELKEPLSDEHAGGGMFPTTTIITKNRIFVPVPHDLMDAFRVTSGAKEFFVRFDLV
ncbi:MAG: ATP-binding protein [Dehalococcoidia bacterium]